MVHFFVDKLKDPLFWTTTVSILINIAQYRINRKTSKQLYKKPKIAIRKISLHPKISDGAGGLLKDTYIRLTVSNPSSLQNLIVSRKLRKLPFGKIIDQGNVNTQIPAFNRSNISISLDYEKVKIQENRMMLLTLDDIKGKKICKIFRLTNTEII